MTPPFMGDVRAFVSPSFYCLVHVVAVIWLGGAVWLGLVLRVKGIRLGLDGCLRSGVGSKCIRWCSHWIPDRSRG